MVLEDYVPYDVMQSQLFVLRILSQCMEAHWKAYRDQLTQHLREANDRDGQENGVNGVSNGVNETVSSIAAAAAARQSDPPPLEDALAKYVLSVLTRFLHDVNTTDEPAVAVEPATNNNNNSSKNKKNEPEPQPASATQNMANVIDPDIASELYKTAGRILFYISASNWPIVFARLKARVQHLSTTNDEWPETAELKLLETASLNQRRLGQVLTGLSLDSSRSHIGVHRTFH